MQIGRDNPLEDIDAKDKGSYANASLIGRIVTIFAGSAANYLVASVFFLVALLMTGQQHATTRISVIEDQPAAKAGMRDDNRVIEVEGTKVDGWDHFRQLVGKRPNQPTQIVVERGAEKVTLTVTPPPRARQGRAGSARGRSPSRRRSRSRTR